MGLSDDYIAGSADWREQLRKNNRNTRLVVITFIGIYLFLGMLIDYLIVLEGTGVTAHQAWIALTKGYVFPFATISMSGVAVIALFVTYSMHDRIMLLGTEYREVSRDQTRDPEELQLVNIVEELTIAAGMHFVPRIYIIEANYMNAFASGYSEKSAMVAITRGLLTKLTRAETQAVMAHELSHIRHNDIKLTLTVGVLSNIMLLVIDVLFHSMLYRRRNNSESNRLQIVIIILRYAVPILTVLLTLFLSRTREYMADAGAVQLQRDNRPMAEALMKIHQDHQANAVTYREEYGDTAHEDVRRAAYLYDPVKAGIEPLLSISSLFSTHPSLAQRLAAIGFKKK